MTSAECSQYRVIGERLALYVRQQQGGLPSVAALQAVIADLAADQAQLVLPLRELVARPGFARLATKVGSASGALECQALLQSMEDTFMPALIAALAEVLSGFLDLPSPVSTSATPSASPPQLPPNAQPKAARSPQGNANGGAKAGTTPVTPAPQPARPSSSGGSFTPRGRTSRLVPLAVLSATVAATAVIVSTSSPLCKALGLCAIQQPGATSQPSLDAAAAAEQALRRAQNLAEYRQASEQLERALLQLRGDNLTTQQKRLRQQLQTTATQARSILREEEADQELLDLAIQAMSLGRTATGPEREQQLNTARQALDAIPPRSFSAGEAARLRERISVLKQETQQGASPAAELDGSQPAEPSRGTPVAPSSPARGSSAPQAPPFPRAEPLDRAQPLF